MVHEDGVPAATTPPRNTVMTLDGTGLVILNEQFCDGSALLPPCTGTTHSGLTVRGIRLVVTVPSNPRNPAGLAPGTEIIVAEAHSDASLGAVFPKLENLWAVSSSVPGKTARPQGHGRLQGKTSLSPAQENLHPASFPK